MAQNMQIVANQQPVARRVRLRFDGSTECPGIATNQIGFRATREVIMLHPENHDHIQALINTCVIATNESSHDPFQCVAYYLSVLGCVFPGIKDVGKEYLLERGFSVTELNERTMGGVGMELLEWVDVGTALAVWGQLVLVMFKHIDQASYTPYFQARTNAIKGEIGVPFELNPEGGDVLLGLEAATCINSILGRANKLKACVLRLMIKYRTSTDIVGRVSAYCCEILCWNELSYLIFVWDTLCMCKSPVLADTRVHREVLNLGDAIDQLVTQEYPQYYRILSPTDAALYFMKSRFPTLIEVAKRIRQSQMTTIINFATTMNTEANTLVSELIQIHTNYMTGGRMAVIPRTLRKLTETEEAEEPAGRFFRNSFLP